MEACLHRRPKSKENMFTMLIQSDILEPLVLYGEGKKLGINN